MPRVETSFSPLSVKYVRLTSLYVYYRCTLQMIRLWAWLNLSQSLPRNLYDVLATMSYWFSWNDFRGLPFCTGFCVLRCVGFQAPIPAMVSSFQRLRFARIFLHPFEFANKTHVNREGAVAATRNAYIIPGNMRMKIREWGSVASVQPLLPLLLLVHGAMPSSFFPMHFLLLDFASVPFLTSTCSGCCFFFYSLLAKFGLFFFCQTFGTYFEYVRVEVFVSKDWTETKCRCFLCIFVDQRFFFCSNCHLLYCLSFHSYIFTKY